MKMTKQVTTAMIFGFLSLGTGLAIATTLPTRGPIPFATWDADSNGTISQQEFDSVRQQRQETAKNDNRMGRHMANAPTFTEIDGNSDGQITAEEMATMRPALWRKDNKGRYHKGNKHAMKGHGGHRFQNMDAETREKHSAFLTATTALRKDIAVKRAEKRAIMRSDNPDPNQTAQLTGELFDLRSQMRAKAEEAGIAYGHGKGQRGRW